MASGKFVNAKSNITRQNIPNGDYEAYADAMESGDIQFFWVGTWGIPTSEFNYSPGLILKASMDTIIIMIISVSSGKIAIKRKRSTWNDTWVYLGGVIQSIALHAMNGVGALHDRYYKATDDYGVWNTSWLEYRGHSFRHTQLRGLCAMQIALRSVCVLWKWRYGQLGHKVYRLKQYSNKACKFNKQYFKSIGLEIPVYRGLVPISERLVMFA